ncbi:MAG: MarR family winged helix-turn-helix transcriptional regulator [Parvibaculaceae bacterium]
MQNKSETALIALRQILRAADMNARRLAKQSELTPSQFMILQILGRNDEMVPSAIAREVSLTQATVTSLIDKLERRRLVERRRDTQDRRRVLIDLTDAGRETLAQAPDTLQDQFVAKFSKLEEWEQTFVISALERVALILGVEDLDAAPVFDAGPIDKTIGV